MYGYLCTHLYEHVVHFFLHLHRGECKQKQQDDDDDNNNNTLINMLYNKVTDTHWHRHTASRQTWEESNLTSYNSCKKKHSRKNFTVEDWKIEHLYLYKDYSH